MCIHRHLSAQLQHGRRVSFWFSCLRTCLLNPEYDTSNNKRIGKSVCLASMDLLLAGRHAPRLLEEQEEREWEMFWMLESQGALINSHLFFTGVGGLAKRSTAKKQNKRKKRVCAISQNRDAGSLNFQTLALQTDQYSSNWVNCYPLMQWKAWWMFDSNTIIIWLLWQMWLMLLLSALLLPW